MDQPNWKEHMQRNEEITAYIPVALSHERWNYLGVDHMVQLTKPNGRRRYGIAYPFGTDHKILIYPSVTTETEGQLRNFGMELWKDGWIRRGLDKYEGKVLTHDMIQEILFSHVGEAQRSADTGTQVHNYIDKLLKGEDVNDIPDQLEPAIQGFLKWRRKYIDWKYIGSELGVFSIKQSVAGTVDALFETPDGYMIVDWKTSSGIYESHAIQVGVYAQAFKDMTKKRKPVGAMIVRLDNNYPLQDQVKDRTKPKIFTDRVDMVRLTQEECRIYAGEIPDLRSLKSRHARKLNKETL